jgi:FtsH-binding integral membrane protein
MYAEPKPIESVSHIGLVVLTAAGYMLASFLAGTIVLLILMIFIKQIKKDFWNFSTLMMMGGVKLLVLSNLFI